MQYNQCNRHLYINKRSLTIAQPQKYLCCATQKEDFSSHLNGEIQSGKSGKYCVGRLIMVIVNPLHVMSSLHLVISVNSLIYALSKFRTGCRILLTQVRR